MENLNTEITSEILSWVPSDSILLRCTRVSKTWRTLILNSYFASMHHHRQLQLLKQFDDELNNDNDDDDDQKYNHSNININGGGSNKVGMGLLFWIMENGILKLHYGEYYDEENINIHDNQEEQPFSCTQLLTRIIHHPPIAWRQYYRNSVVGSCNGLICLSVRHHDIDDPVYICNPITREYVYLPRLAKRIFQDCMVSGFGYHPSSNQYKVVRVYYDPLNDEDTVGYIQVYTIGDGRGWRSIGVIPFGLPANSPGISMNGALHGLDNEQRKIVAFDLADEKFRLLPAPPGVRPLRTREKNFELRELRRCLCVVYWDDQGESVEIWSLKKRKISSYDMNEQADYYFYHSWSWTREFSIELKGLSMEKYETFNPFAITKCGEVLFQHDSKILSLYDPKSATIKKLVDDAI
ncbi:F-box domain [Macleaya cordata]|uniref:F-box domain n=1 Tax=Macleaya cordata TaxID=56857 RepID=A0A200QIU8_MACCD|nr:F-box domain [Macleaya cordata]